MDISSSGFDLNMKLLVWIRPCLVPTCAVKLGGSLIAPKCHVPVCALNIHIRLM